MTQDFIPPLTQQAVVVNERDEVFVWDSAPCPAMAADRIYIRTEAVAINPSDTKIRGGFVTPGGILGTDYAGTVVAVGSQVKDSMVAVGDRVCGAQNTMHAEQPERGAFGQWNASSGGIWMKLPPSWSVEAGASLGAGISTAGIAIKLLGLPLPDNPVDKAEMVLVYGGSTATATIAIQLLKLANLVPIATCSPRNSDLVKANGATAVFDYRDKDCVIKIREYTKGNLRYALDCITTVESTTSCLGAIGRAGGRYVALDPIPAGVPSRKVVKMDWVLGPSIFGEGSTWPAPYGRGPSEEMRCFGQTLFDLAQRLVWDGKLKHHPLHVLAVEAGQDGSGLERVLEGLQLVRSGSRPGEKVVVRIHQNEQQVSG